VFIAALVGAGLACSSDDKSLAARGHDAEVHAWGTRSISSGNAQHVPDEMLDAARDKPYQLNLYQGPNSSTVERARVDLDRDGKFDEKYSFGPNGVQLQRAPHYDENYTDTYIWKGGRWQRVIFAEE
jgi:hypothetical protein